MRFCLDGDVVPDTRIPFAIPPLDETRAPLFDLRGIQPFHDFTEGPDWWNRDDYLAYLSQPTKLRLNFLGLHCYPEGGVGPEPLVWIGLTNGLAADGRVEFAYPSFWANTPTKSRVLSRLTMKPSPWLWPVRSTGQTTESAKGRWCRFPPAWCMGRRDECGSWW